MKRDDDALELNAAMVSAGFARGTIRQHRGYDKELARDSYASCVGERLAPAISVMVETLLEELEPREVERLGALVLKFIADSEARTS